MKSYTTERERIGFSARLYELRQKMKYTQEYVAGEMNVACSTYGKWEIGDRKPTFDQIINLSRIFEVTTDYLLTGVQSKNVDIHREIGLSDFAIENLRAIKTHLQNDDKNNATVSNVDWYFKSLSKALSSSDFVNAVSIFMGFEQGKPGYHYDAIQDGEFYNTRLSPDSFRLLLSSQITLILNALVKGDDIPVGNYAPYIELVKKTTEELRAQGRLIEKGDLHNVKETRKS